MNHTPHLQLNQWEKTDRIRMEDFNADNAKLEETLLAMQDVIAAAAAACPVVKLLDMTTTEDLTQLDLDVSDIDLTQYHQLDVRLTNLTGDSVRLRLNGLSSGYYRGSENSAYLGSLQAGGSYSAVACFHLMLGTKAIACSTENYYMQSSGGGTSNGYTICRLTAAEVKTLNLFGGSSVNSTTSAISAGLRIQIYGLKK